MSICTGDAGGATEDAAALGERAVGLGEDADCALRTGEGAVGPIQDSLGGTSAGWGTLSLGPGRAP